MSNKTPNWAVKPKHRKEVVATDKGWIVKDTGEMLLRVNGLLDKLKEFNGEKVEAPKQPEKQEPKVEEKVETKTEEPAVKEEPKAEEKKEEPAKKPDAKKAPAKRATRKTTAKKTSTTTKK